MAGDRRPDRTTRTPRLTVTRSSPAATGASISPLFYAAIVNSGGSTASSRSSAARPRSRRRSSAAASACRPDQALYKPVLPIPDTMLDEKLGLAPLWESLPGSAGPCSPKPSGLRPTAVTADRQAVATSRDGLPPRLSLPDHASRPARGPIQDGATRRRARRQRPELAPVGAHLGYRPELAQASGHFDCPG
jgi:hypothetical protein